MSVSITHDDIVAISPNCEQDGYPYCSIEFSGMVVDKEVLTKNPYGADNVQLQEFCEDSLEKFVDHLKAKRRKLRVIVYARSAYIKEEDDNVQVTKKAIVRVSSIMIIGDLSGWTPRKPLLPVPTPPGLQLVYTESDGVEVTTLENIPPAISRACYTCARLPHH